MTTEPPTPEPVVDLLAALERAVNDAKAARRAMPDPPEDPWVTSDVGHVVVTDPVTGRHRCSCGRFTTFARDADGVTAHLATHTIATEDPTP